MRLVCLTGLSMRDELGEWASVPGDVWLNPDDVSLLMEQDDGSYAISMRSGKEFLARDVDAQVLADSFAEVDAQYIELPILERTYQYDAVLNIHQIKAIYTNSENVCLIEFKDGEVVRTSLSYSVLREMPQIVRRGLS